MTYLETPRVTVGKTIRASLIETLEASPVGQVISDDTGRILFANRLFLAFVSPGRAEVQPERLGDLDALPGLPQAGKETALGPQLKLIWSQISKGEWLGTVVPKASQAPAPPIGNDPLTGLCDRRSLADQWDAIRGETGLYTLYLDLDQFKQVNDTLGHEAGDALLRSVAQRIRGVLREDDVIARYGGDEFVALIDGSTEASVVESIADRLIEMLSRPFLVTGRQVSVGVSIGMTKSRESDLTVSLRHADVALYESKRRGRGRATWYTEEMTRALERRSDLEQGLRKALLLEEFVVYFQPQYAFDSRSITGFEALVRWQRGDELVPPDDFIPLAEETGIILQLGAYVLDIACKEARAWPEMFTVSVNVSAKQFTHESFVETVKQCLEISGLDPRRLELELTETLLMASDDRVLERMHLIRDLGVALSLDDFGTGNASINYLRKFPFSKIKIDQSYIREPFANDQTRKIVDAVARLGVDLGMSVIAEGVETQEQKSRLQEQGVNAIQGFLLSRPMPADQVSAFLTQWQNDTTGSE